ncbi:glycosyltransferase [Sphingomonas naphthae]|uniref:Glycosyltransferase n=1 Tax=Sphingomonas naphthae TaxID=1813468 RepID=A0ABY7TNM1_9SPHN|nr:glycosyltransferase [Sphingomonas naphthae]WCT73449.1 glycosyltransferase [Sphingomonas naphthae]
MSILHIIASADPADGGPIEAIRRQEEATGAGAPDAPLRELVTLDRPDAPFLADFPIPIHALGRPGAKKVTGWRHPFDRLRYSPDYVPWLRANIHRFDAVVVHGLWNYSVFAASRVLPGSGVPYFVFTHGMMDPYFRRQYPLKHVAKQALWLGAEGRLLEGASSVFFTCEEERRLARTSFFGHRYRETVVGFGTAEPPAADPTDGAALEEAVSGLDGSPFLLFLSRIHPKKGCDDLIAGFARVAGMRPELKLVVAGPDATNWRPALEARAAAAGVAHRILWPGPLYDQAKWAAMRAAEAFILPSHQENFGIAVAEALACATPVLITDQVNIWREIDEAGAGFITSDDVGGVARVLRRWFALDEAKRAEMRAAARHLFIDRFSVAETAPQLLRTMAAMAGHARI